MRPITGEAVTDGSGAFRIPAWGPIRATYWYPPALWLFKSGYSVLTLNSWNSTGHPVSSAAPSSKSHYNGETLELPPFEGTLEKYAEHLATNANQPEWLTQHCAWKGAPKFLSALAAESERFRLAGAKNVWPYDRTYYEKLDTYADVRSECGSIKQFVQEHGQ